jgi:DNA-binding transcriptional regulator YhcF (GntR family)
MPPAFVVTLDPRSSHPPFEQLRTGVASRVASGELPAGTRLPTVRALAEELGVAAGTVARAYRELEADGVVETRGRQGTFVRSTGADPAGDVQAAAARLAEAARRAGLTLAEATRLVEHAWSR